VTLSNDDILELNQAAERLARRFDTLSLTTVIDTISDCADTWPHADAAFIENAARARLQHHGRRQPG
jgi:hypothetical protein